MAGFDINLNLAGGFGLTGGSSPSFSSGSNKLEGTVQSLSASFRGLINVTNQLTNKLADFSPAIAQANAINEIRDLQQSIKFSQNNGPELAKLTLAQGDISRRIEEATNKILLAITPALATVVEMGARATEASIEVASSIKDAAANFGKTLATDIVIPLAQATGYTKELKATAQNFLRGYAELTAQKKGEDALAIQIEQDARDFLDPTKLDRFWKDAAPPPTGRRVL